MKRKWIGIVLCLGLLLGAGLPAAAGSPVLERIVESGKLRVGTSGGQPPFSIKSKEGKLIGFEVDLATMLAGAMGVELQLVEKPFPQLLGALKKGEVDVVMSGMTMTPERNLQAAFVGPYIISGKSILTKDKTLAAASEPEQVDRAGLKVAALANSTSSAFVRHLMPNVELVETQSYDEAVQMVLDDKAAAMVADFPICALSVLRHGDKGLVTLAEPLTIEPIGIAVPPGDSLMLNMVENYLGALDALGVIEELEAMWFDDGSWLIHMP